MADLSEWISTLRPKCIVKLQGNKDFIETFRKIAGTEVRFMNIASGETSFRLDSFAGRLGDLEDIRPVILTGKIKEGWRRATLRSSTERAPDLTVKSDFADVGHFAGGIIKIIGGKV